jgi:hypothetical protein
MRTLIFSCAAGLAVLVALGTLVNAEEAATDDLTMGIALPQIATDCIYGKVTYLGEPLPHQLLHLTKVECEHHPEDYACRTNAYGWYFISLGNDPGYYDFDTGLWGFPTVSTGYVYYPGSGRLHHDINLTYPSLCNPDE